MAIEIHVDPGMGGIRESRFADAAVAALAASQHGVVARRQLLELGIGARAIEHRLECGRLHPIHRGVYAVGHRALSRRGAWMAAVLGAGPGAALSHRSAGALWGIRDSASTWVDVTTSRNRRTRPRLRVHRAVLALDELDVRDGILLTSPARTLFDLAAVLPPHLLERAINEAEVLQLGSPTSLATLLARHPGRRGTSELRRIVERQEIGRARTRSDLEARFLALLDAHGLPRPATNRSLDAGDHCDRRPDAVWHDQRLVVELDGYATHGTRQAFEDDRARDRALQAAGYRTIRVTDRQLDAEPATIARQLATLLQAAAEAAWRRTAKRAGFAPARSRSRGVPRSRGGGDDAGGRHRGGVDVSPASPSPR